MNGTQLRALGFDEAADAADEQQWEGERARVLVQHASKSPLDAPLCAGIAAALEREGERRGYIVNQAAQMWGWLDSEDLPEDTPKDWNDIKGDCDL